MPRRPTYVNVYGDDLARYLPYTLSLALERTRTRDTRTLCAESQRCRSMSGVREADTGGWTVSGGVQLTLDERAVTDSWRAASPRIPGGRARAGGDSPALLDVRTSSIDGWIS